MSDEPERASKRRLLCRFSCVMLIAALLVGCSDDPEPDPDASPSDTAETDVADASSEPDAEPTDVTPDTGLIPEGATGESLVDHEAWSPIGAAADPLADHRPDQVDCPNSTYQPEPLNHEPSLAILTQACNYFTAAQEVQTAISEGDRLRARVWHFELTGDEPATAHAAIAVDGDVVWEAEVDIPSEQGNLLVAEWTAKTDYPERVPVVFHLHNHGANEWHLIEFANYGTP